MTRPLHLLVLVALLLDGGTASPPPPPPPASQRTDAGTASPGPLRWPAEVRPLATLDGPAVIAAHAALQELLARYAKVYPGDCDYSAKAMEVMVGEAQGLYFVRIEQHVDRCGWAGPGFVAEPDWSESYVVTPEGKVLARNPPAQ
jgi:hypothetical protein